MYTRRTNVPVTSSAILFLPSLLHENRIFVYLPSVLFCYPFEGYESL